MSNVLFLRKSKKGNHLFAFAGDTILIMPIEKVQDLIDDKLEKDYVIVSVMEQKDE
jgi:hypothetical protein